MRLHVVLLLFVLGLVVALRGVRVVEPAEPGRAEQMMSINVTTTPVTAETRRQRQATRAMPSSAPFSTGSISERAPLPWMIRTQRSAISKASRSSARTTDSLLQKE